MRPLFHALAAGLPLLALPAAAQVAPPWTNIYTTTDGTYIDTSLIQVPTPTSIWAVYSFYGGMGAGYVNIINSIDTGANWELYRSGFHGPSGSYPPLPTGGIDFDDLWAVSGQEAWAVVMNWTTNARELRHTTTGPAGFAATPAQVPGQRFVRFFTPTTGVVFSTTAGTPVYRTTDAGQSWQPVAAQPAVTVSTSSPAVSPNTCVMLGQHAWVVCANNQLAHTPDAGLTWTTSTLPALAAGIAFRDPLHGLAYSTSGSTNTALYRTADGGQTWSAVAPLGPVYYPNANTNSIAGGALTAVPGSPGTYLSTVDEPTTSQPTNAGTSISYDEGEHWRSLETSAGVSRAAVSATSQVWSLSHQNLNTHYIYINRLAGVALATAAPQAATAAGAYPNPTTGLLHLPAAGAHRQATVYDAAGRQCRTAMLGPTATDLDLTSLGAGLYLLRLADGTAPTQQQRIVVTAP